VATATAIVFLLPPLLQPKKYEDKYGKYEKYEDKVSKIKYQHNHLLGYHTE
jgi:prolyl-tRNA synthetase